MTDAQAEGQVEASPDAGGAGDGPVEEATGPNAQQNRQPSKMESFMAMAKSLILRGLIIYFVSSFFRKPAPQAADQATAVNAGPKIHAWNYFENGTLFDLHVWLSENADGVDFKQTSNLVWLQNDLTYGDWSSGQNRDGTYTHNLKLKTSTHLMNNGSLYLHAFVTLAGESPDPLAPNFARKGLMGHQQRQLNKFKRIKVNRNYNLLTGEKERVAAEIEAC